MRYLLLALLISCASNPNKTIRKPDALKKYIKKFEYLLGRKLTKTKIRFGYIYDDRGNKRRHATGVCDGPTKKVIINKLRWKTLSETQKEFLVFHELGHCELGLGHPDHQRTYTIPQFILGGCPKSIMNSGTSDRKMSDKCYKFYYRYYIHELFSLRTRRILR